LIAAPFPAATAALPEARLHAKGIALRPATDTDMPFLLKLYAASRANELAHVPWTDASKAAFVASQFALQHRHFTTPGIATDLWIVEIDSCAAGRLYANREPPVWRLVEIALCPSVRERGIGSMLLDWLKRTARLAGATGIDLHVLVTNPRAAALYARQGFVAADGGSETHRRMIWPVS